MALYAKVDRGVVRNVVDSDSPPGSPWVACPATVGRGWTYDGSTFAAPIPIAAYSLTQREFVQRFTAAEREALENKAQTGTQGVKDKIAAFKTYIQTGGRIELNDDYIIAVVMQMEAAGVIAAGRAAEILAP